MKTITIYEKEWKISFFEWAKIIEWCSRLVMLKIQQSTLNILDEISARKLLYKSS